MSDLSQCLNCQKTVRRIELDSNYECMSCQASFANKMKKISNSNVRNKTAKNRYKVWVSKYKDDARHRGVEMVKYLMSLNKAPKFFTSEELEKAREIYGRKIKDNSVKNIYSMIKNLAF